MTSPIHISRLSLKTKFVLIVFIIVQFVPGFAGTKEIYSAQTDEMAVPVIDFPEMKVGDTYSFKIGKSRRFHVHHWKVITVNHGKSFVIEQDCAGEITTLFVDNTYTITNAEGELRNKVFQIDFPLSKDKKWDRAFTIITDEKEMMIISQNYKVEGYETIDTASGPLPAFRISVVQRKLGSQLIGRGMMWYAPKVKFPVRVEYESIWPVPEPEIELTGYSQSGSIEQER